MPEPERIDRRRAALIAYDVCRRALAPSDPARRAAMRSVLDAWVQMIAVARAARVPVIYTTPVSRADGADVVMLPTDLSAETGVPPLTNGVVETSIREAFNLDLASVVVRECCWGSDAAAHAYSLDKAMKMYARIRTLDQVVAMLRE